MENYVQNANEVKIDKEKINYLERSRQNNIRVNGIPENQNETWEETENKLKVLIKEELKIEKEIVIERAHRTGKSKENKHRENSKLQR